MNLRVLKALVPKSHSNRWDVTFSIALVLFFEKCLAVKNAGKKHSRIDEIVIKVGALFRRLKQEFGAQEPALANWHNWVDERKPLLWD